MADEVKATEVTTPVEAPAVEEKKTARGGRKKGTAKKTAPAKKATAKATEKKPGRKSAVKAPAKKAEKKAAPAPALDFKALTIEFGDKKFTEKDLHDRVSAYISSHPYIVAHDIEVFVKPDESCAYFTVDGFSNPDFKIEL